MNTWDLTLVKKAFAAAAVNPSLWSKALDVVTEQTESRGALLLPISGDHLPNMPSSEGLVRATEAYFADGWHKRDERFRGVPKLLRDGVIDDFDCVTLDQMKHLPYYQEFLAPFGLRWFACVKIASGDDVWGLSIQRGEHQDPFSEVQKSQLAYLSKPLSTTAAVSRALGFAAADAALEAFDISQTAAVLLNRRAEVIRTNRSGHRLLTGDVRICARRLTSIDPSATAAIERASHCLLWSDQDAALMPPIPMPRRDLPPVLAYPMKLAKVTAHVLADCPVIIVLVEPGARSKPQEAALRAAFGLSPAEARLAARLAMGEALGAICDNLGIAKETGRSELKAIFAKTGARRQHELVALVASLQRRPSGDLTR
ncbi:helix-turn-helix transcriptional regulator [Bradyrhizobium sp. 193]|uniref:helix-turn-helix transcriptional regulator n=1 Tax=unclassified Bradyrhizobium TaxID=2631580 RepID=UPI001FF80893|nr:MULTISPECIES: helix-turn-helix transcriptional regulator [unclassified Bradyrhizobium]MCK1485083.1 helix-turn-helix transcriptional regulator [Bradyrhizobium sp. 193]MCK1586312.1 helix-turn-helix transcriptional regulator [Bradyrhizobium sp. 169]